MATLISVFVSGVGVVHQGTAQPLQPMRLAVQNEIDNASRHMGCELRPQSILFSDSNLPVDNWEGRNVGTNAITVIGVEAGTSPSLLSMLQSLSKKVSMLEERLVVTEEQMLPAWTPRIRNAAAQLLMHACGEQSFQQTSSTWFRQLGAEDKGVQQLAQAMSVQPKQLMWQADNVVSRRNADIHPGIQEALDEEVSMVLGVLTPAMERAMPWECQFLRAYEAVKQAFPQQFGSSVRS
eukprot:351301-Chlamydomonas_euryale.AAC.3